MPIIFLTSIANKINTNTLDEPLMAHETLNEELRYLIYFIANIIFDLIQGLFVSGILGDRFNLRYVLSIGMVFTNLFQTNEAYTINKKFFY